MRSLDRAASRTNGSRTIGSSLRRVGAGCAVTGSLAAGIGNLLHPVTPRHDPAGVARVIADSGTWTAIHLVILVGLLLMVAGLAAIGVAIVGPSSTGALARLAVSAAVLGAGFGAITLVLDGVAAKQLADTWSGNPSEVTLNAAIANETVNFALAGLFNLVFAGVAYLLLGCAMVGSANFRPWIGRVAIVAGTFSILAGGYQLVSGRPTTASLVLTIIGPTVITLWTMLVGVLIWRRGSDPEPDVSAVAAARPPAP